MNLVKLNLRITILKRSTVSWISRLLDGYYPKFFLVTIALDKNVRYTVNNYV